MARFLKRRLQRELPSYEQDVEDDVARPLEVDCLLQSEKEFSPEPPVPPKKAALEDGQDSEILFKSRIGEKREYPKFVTLKTYRGVVYVDIREFYFSKTDKTRSMPLAGRKGIILPLADFENLVQQSGQIRYALIRRAHPADQNR